MNNENEKYEELNNENILRHFGGLCWKFKNGLHKLSVICHNGSYGHEKGLFEILPNWKKASAYDDVEGFLTFEEVGNWIKELNSLNPNEETEHEELLRLRGV